MSTDFIPEQGLCFLPLNEEALLLLKHGVISLRQAQTIGLPWLQPEGSNLPNETDSIGEEDYLQHLRLEYARLPANLQSLLSLEQFFTQAEKKRTEIEAALLAQRNHQQQRARGNIEDWFMRRFFTSPFSILAWQQHGWASIWLGIDASRWPQAQLEPLQFREKRPLDFPARLLCEATELAALSELRLVRARHQCEKIVRLAGEECALVRLPPNALRAVLFGSSIPPNVKAQFLAYWRQDLRYRRIPVAQMHHDARSSAWHFQPL